LPGLVDDELVRPRLELLHDVPARFAADEDSAAGTGIADAGANPLRAPELVG
jgi:hypothetical protein